MSVHGGKADLAVTKASNTRSRFRSRPVAMGRSARGLFELGVGIGRIEATCQPFASRTKVWLIRNVLFWVVCLEGRG